MENKEILAEIKKAVMAIEPDAEIILFGSEARGTASKHSDIDLLILHNRELSFEEKMEISGTIYDIELEHSKIISPIIVSHKVWEDQRLKSPFYYEVKLDGIQL
ncbi:MAG: nucleotidyltransferase domain-containing protein [Cytophagales bacterium]|nr:nucleotidyltransferase domain-containing protein [Cytophagales bacterium]